MTAPPSLLADALRDHYLLERELGQGGMATVYLARDLRHRHQWQQTTGLRVLGDRFYFNLGDQQSDLWMAEM